MTVVADLSGLEGIERRHTDILEEASRRAEFEMRAYVPIDQGILRASGQLSSQFRQGLLVWSTPYAAAQYYIPMSHPVTGTTDHWDEAWARDRMGQWAEYVEKLYEEAM